MIMGQPVIKIKFTQIRPSHTHGIALKKKADLQLQCATHERLHFYCRRPSSKKDELRSIRESRSAVSP